MNNEEHSLEEKIYRSIEGSEIKIIYSNLGRRYKKIGDKLYLMLEKESARLEDELTAMIRLSKENEEIARKKEIENIKKEAKKELQQVEEVKNTEIQELRNELEQLKKLYAEKQKEKERNKREKEKQKLKIEIDQFKEELQKTKTEIETETESEIESDIQKVEIGMISTDNNLDDNYSETSETYTELIEKTKNLELNTNTKLEVNTGNIKEEPTEPTTSRSYKSRPSYPRYTNEQSKRDKILWDKRLNRNWTPKPIDEQTNFLNLDCVTDTNKTIQLWIGYISKQLIDNKISIDDAPGYIERTFIGTTKLWLQNLSEDSKTVLRNNKRPNNEAVKTNIEILEKYEIAIRNEFESSTTEFQELQKDKILNRNLMNKLSICNMCYLEQYTCAFKEYYYKGWYNQEEAKEIRKLYFSKLPEPFSSKVKNDWEETELTDTLGARIKFLERWFRQICEKHKEDIKIGKILVRNLACCKNKTAPQFGCTEKYKNKKRRYKKPYKPYKIKYRNKKPQKRYYVKNYKYKRPFRTKKKLTECKCYNCGKIGHKAIDCKIPRDPKRKQMAEIEVKIEENKYTQLEYIDYELEEEDSIYAISDKEINETDIEYNTEEDIQSNSEFEND